MDGSRLMENKFRSICVFCTALSFTAFAINVSYYPEDTNLYTSMCSALIALFTLLTNRASDVDMMKKGISTGKYTTWAKVYRIISTVRLWIETIVAGVAMFLVLAYFLTNSNQGDILISIPRTFTFEEPQEKAANAVSFVDKGLFVTFSAQIAV